MAWYFIYLYSPLFLSMFIKGFAFALDENQVMCGGFFLQKHICLGIS